MGHKLGLDGDGMGEPQCRIFENGLGTKRIEDTYSKSWDWLMPVVEKIFALSVADENIELFYDVQTHIPDKTATYNAVVEFIKEYNNDTI